MLWHLCSRNTLKSAPYSRAQSWIFAALVFIPLINLCTCRVAKAPQYDLLIVNGRIVDGGGSPWSAGSVAVRGDKIVDVGRLAGATAKHVIDASGMVVAPGFIDLHTHSDFSSVDAANGIRRQGIPASEPILVGGGEHRGADGRAGAGRCQRHVAGGGRPKQQCSTDGR